MGVCCAVLCAEDGLTLEVTDRFYTNWIKTQWDSWMSQTAPLALPDSGWDRSKRSKEARGLETQDARMAWSVTTMVLLSMLCRWSTTLKEKGRASARCLLAGLLGTTFGQKELTWHCRKHPSMGPSVWPPTVGEDVITVSVASGMASMGPLFEHFPWLAKLRRSSTYWRSGLATAPWKPLLKTGGAGSCVTGRVKGPRSLLGGPGSEACSRMPWPQSPPRAPSFMLGQGPRTSSTSRSCSAMTRPSRSWPSPL